MRMCIYICVCVCIFVHRLWVLVSVLQQCGRRHACACVFVCMCMRICMCVGIYICAFFLQWVLHALWNRCFGHSCMGRCVYYTGVILHERTRLRTHSLQVVHICVYVYMCVHACICIWMRMYLYDIAWHVEVLLLRFSICAYVCICMCMYMCVHVCVYMCMCICM